MRLTSEDLELLAKQTSLEGLNQAFYGVQDRILGGSYGFDLKNRLSLSYDLFSALKDSLKKIGGAEEKKGILEKSCSMYYQNGLSSAFAGDYLSNAIDTNPRYSSLRSGESAEARSIRSRAHYAFSERLKIYLTNPLQDPAETFRNLDPIIREATSNEALDRLLPATKPSHSASQSKAPATSRPSATTSPANIRHPSSSSHYLSKSPSASASPSGSLPQPYETPTAPPAGSRIPEGAVLAPLVLLAGAILGRVVRNIYRALRPAAAARRDAPVITRAEEAAPAAPVTAEGVVIAVATPAPTENPEARTTAAARAAAAPASAAPVTAEGVVMAVATPAPTENPEARTTAAAPAAAAATAAAPAAPYRASSYSITTEEITNRFARLRERELVNTEEITNRFARLRASANRFTRLRASANGGHETSWSASPSTTTPVPSLRDLQLSFNLLETPRGRATAGAGGAGISVHEQNLADELLARQMQLIEEENANKEVIAAKPDSTFRPTEEEPWAISGPRGSGSGRGGARRRRGK